MRQPNTVKFRNWGGFFVEMLGCGVCAMTMRCVECVGVFIWQILGGWIGFSGVYGESVRIEVLSGEVVLRFSFNVVPTHEFFFFGMRVRKRIVVDGNEGELCCKIVFSSWSWKWGGWCWRIEDVSSYCRHLPNFLGWMMILPRLPTILILFLLSSVLSICSNFLGWWIVNEFLFAIRFCWYLLMSFVVAFTFTSLKGAVLSFVYLLGPVWDWESSRVAVVYIICSYKWI